MCFILLLKIDYKSRHLNQSNQQVVGMTVCSSWKLETKQSRWLAD
jgi:hypothetical protein